MAGFSKHPDIGLNPPDPDLPSPPRYGENQNLCSHLCY